MFPGGDGKRLDRHGTARIVRRVFDDEEMREPGRRRQAKDPGQERRRPLLVTAGDDGVVQLHAHPVIAPGVLASERSYGRVHESRVPAGALVYPKLSGSWVGP
jgi:hypothetical protein